MELWKDRFEYTNKDYVIKPDNRKDVNFKLNKAKENKRYNTIMLHHQLSKMGAVAQLSHITADSAPQIRDASQDSRFCFFSCRRHGAMFLRPIRLDPKATSKSLRWMEDLFPPSSKADEEKMNLRLSEILAAALRHKDTKLYDLKIAFRFVPIGSYSSMIIASIIHAIGNPQYSKLVHCMYEDESCCMSPEQWNGYFKAIGVAIRRSERWKDGTKVGVDEIVLSSYLEMILGRSNLISDWEQEKKNRTVNRINLRDPFFDVEHSNETNNQYLSQLRNVILNILYPIVSKDVTDEGWTDFVRKRQSWISGGSAAGAKILVTDGVKIRADKHAFFDSIKSSEMDKWLDSEPRIRAIGSNKYEQSKARAIYGTECIDYAIMTYVLKGVENNLKRVEGLEEALTEDQEIAATLNRLKISEKIDLECSMFDYTDFNLQHTLEAQSLIYDVLIEIFTLTKQHPDKIKAARWSKEAFLNSYTKFPGDKEYVRVVQGLFSGCRPTHFNNTILNLAYYKLAKMMVEEKFNIIIEDHYSVHKGDDVWVSQNSRLYSVLVFNTMVATGFDFNPAKQRFGRQAGEFLRVQYMGGECKGFLSRALGTLIERPIQSQDIIAPADKVSALGPQINILYRRGLNQAACEVVYDATIPYWSRFSHPTLADVSIPKHIVLKDYKLNGLDIGYPNTLPSGGSTSKRIPAMKLPRSKYFNDINNDMSTEWTNYLSRTIKSEIDYNRVRDVLHENNIMKTLEYKDRIGALKAHANEIRKWASNLKHESIERNHDNYTRYIDGGQYRDEIAQILRRIEQYHDPKIIYTPNLIVSHLMTAIHGSPFRDLATVQRAIKCSVIAAAEICIQYAYSDEKRSLASECLNTMKTSLPVEVVAHILMGLRGINNSYESRYHPIVLSLLSSLALDLALRISFRQPIKNYHQWITLLDACQRDTLHTASHFPYLEKISHY